MQPFIALLRLMRPANVVTAVADILAGVAISGYFSLGYNEGYRPVVALILSTAALYGGGVVLNDYFDAELDKTERPERPIPSGIISKKAAGIFGAASLLAGIVASVFVHNRLFSASTALATAIAMAATVYDKWGKHDAVLGPLNMGLCRGLNLLLGMSIVSISLLSNFFLALVPVAYIGAITLISRGEVHGGKKTVSLTVAILYATVVVAILAFAYLNANLVAASIFLLLFGLFIYPPLLKAVKEPSGPRIGKAVKAGVLGLILMNAAWAAAFGHLYFALVILALLPVSVLLAKAFAVT